ncbi:hypothetical protein ACFPM1_10045 [Halorubrum rubrum]|uniref:Uncharacterized protein n=1 Tax=Halorubrum rubrum TaxID=1126240 RepID=A0ABD5R2M8_9EURY|nr:hypothetical protein [Halorubrum rubrum]
MSDTSFTLLEIHLEEGSVRIGENGLLGGGNGDEAADVEGVDDPARDATGGGILGCERSSKSILGGLAVVALLAALGIAAARVLGEGDLEDAEALDDLGA